FDAFGAGSTSSGTRPKAKALDFYLYADGAPSPAGKYTLEILNSYAAITPEYEKYGRLVWKSDPLRIQIDVHHAASPTCAGLLVLVCGTIVAVYAVVKASRQPRRASGSGQSPPQSRWKMRDLVAFGLVIALSIGWLVDADRLGKHIARYQPIQLTKWTIREI